MKFHIKNKKCKWEIKGKKIDMLGFINHYIKNPFSYKKVLNIGSEGNFSFSSEIYSNASYVVIIEPFCGYMKSNEKNAEKQKNEIDIKIIRTFAINVGKIFKGKVFNLCFWWHGPEHIERDELKINLIELEKVTSDLILIGCPWGKYYQKEKGENIYQKHLSFLYEKDFTNLGYKVAVIGTRDKKRGRLLAWKYIK